MKSTIQRELDKAEQRESQLWYLVLGLLTVFGCIIVAHYGYLLLGGNDGDAGIPRATAYRAVGGLFFLTVLFCLYVLHTLLTNGRMKSLLAEMSSLAATSMELQHFLPSIVRKIAETCSVSTCQIALVEEGSSSMVIRAAYSAGLAWEPQVGAVCPKHPASAWQQALETDEPVVLGRRGLQQLQPEERAVLTGGLEDCRAVLVAPLIIEQRRIGLILLGMAKGSPRQRFKASTVLMAQALARHAAAAIYQATLKRQAIHDPLTNLFNRRHFSQRLSQEIKRSERKKQTAVILMCDLDRFKAINDTQGHQSGDEVLKAVAQSIRESTRGTDLVFRWGGDEIVVVLSDSSRSGALIVAERVRSGVLELAEDKQHDLDITIGIALYPEHGKDEDELIQVADKALYVAKKSGEKVHIGGEEDRLGPDSVKIVFQPVVDIASNCILGHEALCRDPKDELNVFEFFEKHRAMGRLNELKQVTLTSQITEAHRVGLDRVFVNADFGVLGELEPPAIPPGIEVVIELSELEALNDLDSHLEVARSWRDRGYRFAIDDFGAGFISLPFLAMLVPDYVKVDRAAMLQAVASDEFRCFLTSLLKAVRTYAPEGIIAEGIEEERELELVKEMGISLVQGYLLGRPVTLSRAPKSVDILAHI